MEQVALLAVAPIQALTGMESARPHVWIGLGRRKGHLFGI